MSVESTESHKHNTSQDIGCTSPHFLLAFQLTSPHTFTSLHFPLIIQFNLYNTYFFLYIYIINIKLFNNKINDIFI